MTSYGPGDFSALKYSLPRVWLYFAKLWSSDTPLLTVARYSYNSLEPVLHPSRHFIPFIWRYSLCANEPVNGRTWSASSK